MAFINLENYTSKPEEVLSRTACVKDANGDFYVDETERLWFAPRQVIKLKTELRARIDYANSSLAGQAKTDELDLCTPELEKWRLVMTDDEEATYLTDNPV